jgi:hypothetical protein
MSQDNLYDHFAHLDCLPREDEPERDETLAELHERIQAELQLAYREAT